MIREELRQARINRDQEITRLYLACPEEERKHFKIKLAKEFGLAFQTVGLIIRRETGIKLIEFNDNHKNIRLRNGITVRKCILGDIMNGL